MQTSISTTTIEDHLHHYSPEESQKLLSRESSINTDLFKHENGMYIFWNVYKSSWFIFCHSLLLFLELLEHIVEDFLICFWGRLFIFVNWKKSLIINNDNIINNIIIIIIIRYQTYIEC